jgi:filamentous hemagglutinin
VHNKSAFCKAVENATKVLLNGSATDEEKAFARQAVKDLFDAATVEDLAESLSKPGARDGLNAILDFWKLDPTERGKLIEKELAATEYNDWFHVGAEQNGYFPLIDFQKGNTVVSLKTVNTKGGSWLADMRNHINDLATRGVNVAGKPATKVLDIRVQPGGVADAKQLIQYGKKLGVIVRILEF